MREKKKTGIRGVGGTGQANLLRVMAAAIAVIQVKRDGSLG